MQDMQENDRIINVDLEKEIKKSFLDYSMSVIVSRALQLFLNFFRGSRRFYGKLGKGRTGGKDCSRGGNNKFFH